MNIQLVPTAERLNVTARLFGLFFPLRLEPFIYRVADHLSKDYTGGYWDFYTLDDTGFLMCPATDQRFNVQCDNYYIGRVSAEAFGIIVSLYAYSHLSFDTEHSNGQLCARLFHKLREQAAGHPEAEAIFAAID